MRSFIASCLLAFMAFSTTSVGIAVLLQPAPLFAASAESLPKLPEPTSSFGAVAANGWIYVYGGHIAPTHNYYKGGVSGAFHRIKFDGATWEKLPGGTPLQGLNLTTDGKRIYRVGGMEPRNEKGTPTENHSLVEAAAFDTAIAKWQPLPDLPHARSSHDLVVLEGKLYVIGGWKLAGKQQEWIDDMAVLDLNAAKPSWSTVPQPFRRRALMAAVLDGKIYAVGGMDDKNRVLRFVSIYDPKAATWSDGPQLPVGPFNGFAPAVAVHKGSLYVSIAGGKVLKLDTAKQTWEVVANVSSRVAHRMVSDGERLLLFGGADDGGNLDTFEVVMLQ